jgi:hypothetical protein
LGLAGAGTAFSLPAQATPGTPIGPTIQVPTSSSLSGSATEVASDAQGNGVVIWADTNLHLFAQRFSADGNLQGEPITLSGSVPYFGGHFQGSVAMNGDGSFMVALIEAGSSPLYSLKLQRFAADGSSMGAPITIATASNPNSVIQSVSLATNSKGDYVLSWATTTGFQFNPFGWDYVRTNYYDWMQAFSSDGTRKGPAVRLASASAYYLYSAQNWLLDDGGSVVGAPYAAITEQGGLITKWAQTKNLAKDLPTITGRIYSATERPLASIAESGGDVDYGSIDRSLVVNSPGGDFASIYIDLSIDYGNNYVPLYLQQYSADGTVSGAPLTIGGTTIGEPVAAAADAAGNMAVAWTAYDEAHPTQSGYDPILLQLFDAQHQAVGTPIVVRPEPPDLLWLYGISVAYDGLGNLWVAWNDSSNLYLQRYSGS